MPKLTIEELIKQKENIKGRKLRTQTLKVDSLGAEIVIQEPKRELALETLEMAMDDARSDSADPHIVYHCVIEPNLKDPTLQKEFGCTEPTDIVKMIFRPSEISSISGHIMELGGFNGKAVTKINDDLKN
ncbi:hypothetical protein BK126_04430 [Paenibacillus sp. FSL H7-0326]|uniref:phage tail assembly chaperone n=1 Tax=Paenibacillus sp. FSL H7-0326 TaxID=1921144 RepID=UPI00096C45B4|nr:hypothetical protein [Paenibacillus sp. FSL H7-0326]OMC71349.1 hypothetical protein BK126_04430 [Paenibacillus sp. FSL H7-0326]